MSCLAIRLLYLLLLQVTPAIDPSILVGCLSTMVSLYIPVAILIYQQDFKEKPDFNEFKFDRTVLLTRVANSKLILGSILASMFVSIFWKLAPDSLRTLFLLVFLAGIFVLSKNLADLYRWFISDKVGTARKSSFRQEQKMSFLRGLDPNNSLDVWVDLFNKIELENAFLPDYLNIFLEKFSEAEEDLYWQYQLCLTNNMDRLYFWSNEFQNILVDFCFDLFVEQNEKRKKLTLYKLPIFEKLIQLLATTDQILCFSVSYDFDKRIESMEDSDAMNAVRSYSRYVLGRIMNIYDEIPKNTQSYNIDIFPTSKWNIASMTDCQNPKQNAKSMGLFITYLSMVRPYMEQRGDKMNKDRAEFLDEIVFGMNKNRISMKIVRVVSLFFSQNLLGVYDGEDDLHVRIRNFIDADYGFYFVDSVTGGGGACFSDQNDTEEDRLRKMLEASKAEADERDRRTLAILTKIYGFLLNVEDMERIKNAAENYDLDDKEYGYAIASRAILESNLANFKDVMSRILSFAIREQKVKKRRKKTS